MKETLTSRIMHFLAENPGATIKEVANALGISQELARSIIYRLKSRGFVEKSGDGYVLSSKGTWFIEGVLKTKHTSETLRESRERAETFMASPSPATSPTMSDEQIYSMIGDLENKIKQIEEQLVKIKDEICSLKKELDKRKRVERVSVKRLHKPVMSLQEAINTYGGLLESMRTEGSIVLIGSLAVDREFYEEFRKKFPLPIEDKERLSEYEQILLEEMVRDARVIVSGGRFYKLIG